MIDGLVSNCWERLLREGETLDSLLETAQRRSLNFIELRQTCLGDYESETFVPIAERLGELAERHSGMTITLALCVPFMGGNLGSEDELLAAGIRAAEALAGNGPAHLRLVDLDPSGSEINSPGEEPIAGALARIAACLAEKQGVLSLENSVYPWDRSVALFRQTRRLLGPQAGHLQLCFDPCNLCLLEGSDANERGFPEELQASDLSMFHIKQSRAGELLPLVADGDVDWGRQLRELRRIEYAGPVLLEIAPSADVWEEIERSIAYLSTLPGSGAR